MEHVDDLCDDLELIGGDLEPYVKRLDEFAPDLFSRIGRDVFEGF